MTVERPRGLIYSSSERGGKVRHGPHMRPACINQQQQQQQYQPTTAPQLKLLLDTTLRGSAWLMESSSAADGAEAPVWWPGWLLPTAATPSRSLPTR